MRKHLNIFLLFLFIFSYNTSITSKDYNKNKQLIDKVAKWQIDNHKDVKHKDLDWTNAAFYRGLVEWASYTSNNDFFQFLTDIGNKHEWSLLGRTYHADDLAMSQTYIKLYEKYKEEKMIKPTKERVDFIVNNPSAAHLWLGAEKWSERWSWCDALFMAPPVYAALYNIYPEEKYLNFMDKEYKEATDSLYNASAHLYYRDRRYIPKKEKNGENVFWGRGNGWVFAGIPLLLNELPKDHPTYNYYLNIYKQMADAVIKCQDKKGSWHASMLDPASYPSPENSASGFFVYGLSWGINKGILKDKKYKKAAQKGWEALTSYVFPDGKLGYVQPVSAAPEKVTAEMTDVYGVGAFLLAGTEITKMK